jgi:hypothetical protein
MPMMSENPVTNAALLTWPSSNLTTITLSITQRIAKLDATVAKANTAAPEKAITKGLGCSDSIERISCQFRRARDVEETDEVRSGTPRFYQRRGAIASDPVVTHDDQTDPRIDEHGHFRRTERQAGITPFKVFFPIGAVLFVAFWAWALFFASKESVNRIEDRAWAERAETICAPVKAELKRLETLADPDIEVRAGLVDQSTDLLSQMLDDIMVTPPTDEKGQAIVPDWISDYRTLLQDRYNYAERLRAGNNVAFTESGVSDVPITERIAKFTIDNQILSCAPPIAGVL